MCVRGGSGREGMYVDVCKCIYVYIYVYIYIYIHDFFGRERACVRGEAQAERVCM